MLNFKDFYYNATRRRGLWLAAVIFALVTPWAVAQTKAGSSSDGEDMKYKGLAEVDLFGGGSFFQQVYQGLGTKHANGGVVGASVTGNFWRYVGVEFGFRTGTNNEIFLLWESDRVPEVLVRQPADDVQPEPGVPFHTARIEIPAVCDGGRQFDGFLPDKRGARGRRHAGQCHFWRAEAERQHPRRDELRRRH